MLPWSPPERSISLSPPLPLVCTLPDGQHRARCQPYDFFGDTTQKHVWQSRTPVRAHDDEISSALVCHAHDDVCREPSGDFHLPRAVEGGRHEITEVRQGFLVVILEHDRGPRWA